MLTQASILGVLVVFYCYLLVRWQYVRRPMLLLLGAAGVVAGLFGWLFGEGFTMRLFSVIGSIVAFVGAVGACYGAALPVNLPKEFAGPVAAAQAMSAPAAPAAPAAPPAQPPQAPQPPQS